MSLKTLEKQAFAVLVTREIDPITRESVEIFLTEDEYRGTIDLMASKNPPMVTILDDGCTVALSDIRRIEPLAHPIKDADRLIDQPPEEIDEPEISEAQRLRNIAKIAEMRAKIGKPMPGGRPLTPPEFEARREQLLTQSNELTDEGTGA